MQNLGCTHTKYLPNVYQKLIFKWTSAFYLARIFVVEYPLSTPLLLDYNPNLETTYPRFHRWGVGKINPIFIPSNENQMTTKT